MARQGTTLTQLVTRWLILIGLLAAAAGLGGMAYADQWQSALGWTLFGGGLVVMLACAAANLGWLMEVLVSRRALFAANVVVMCVLAALIVAGANYLAERRLPLKWRRIDITSKGLYGLSSKTQHVLAGLKKDVRVCALLSRPDIAEKYQDFPFAAEVKDLLDEYAARSPHLKVEYVDMMRQPRAAWEFIVWIKLPVALKEHGVDPEKFKKAFKKAGLDTIQGFNLLRQIDTWDGPEAKIQKIVDRKMGPTLEDLLLGKKKTAAELKKQQEAAKKLRKKYETFLAAVREVLKKAKLDDAKQAELLKAIKDLDIPEPEANSVIFVCGKKSKHIKPYEMVETDYGDNQNFTAKPTKKLKAEDVFTAALMEVTDEKQKNVYFVQGFGEHRIDEWGDRGYSKIKSALEKANFSVKSLDLARKGEVPDDCDVLVCAGPLVPYNTAALGAIRKYLKKGGSLLAMVEPLAPDVGRFRRKPSGLAELLKQYNIDVREDVTALDVTQVVVLTNRGLARRERLSYTVLTARYPQHRIVEDLQGRVTQFVTACFVDAAAKPSNSDYKAARIAQGSMQGWGETDLAALRSGQASKDAKVDVMPPVPIAAAAQRVEEKKSEKTSRIVVIGDSDFVVNNILDNAPTNSDLLVNAVSWLARKESRIGIGPSAGKTRKLVLTRSAKDMIFYVSVVGLPCVWIVFGLTVWLARSVRNAGFTRATARNLAAPFGLLLIIAAVVIGKLEGASPGVFKALMTAGVALLVLSLILAREAIAALFHRRTMAGANALVMSLLALALVFMVCFLASRHYYRLDCTSGHKLGLNDAAAKVVRSIKKWVTIYALYPQSAAVQNPLLAKVQNDLEEFQYNSPYINVDYVPYDPEKRRAFFQALKLEPNPRTLVVFQPKDSDKVRYVLVDEVIRQDMDQRTLMQMRMQGMTPPPPKYCGEEVLTNALKFVAEAKQQVVYFTTGHGERDINKRKGDGFGDAKDALRRRGYRIKTVNLKETGEAPSDCDALVVAAPKTPFSAEEIDALRTYCDEGGRLMVLLEPSIRDNRSSGLADLLADYKINIDESVLVVDSADMVRLTQTGFVPVRQASVRIRVSGDGYLFPDITDSLKTRGMPTEFYTACKVDAEESPPQSPYGPPPDDKSPYKASKLLQASPDGWGETNVAADGTPVKDANDENGPIPFAAVVEPKQKPRQPWMPPEENEEANGPRIVCIGDADWASSYFLKAGENVNESFLLKCMEWLTKEKGEVKIPATPIEPPRIPEIKPATRQWMFALSVIGLPVAWICVGLLVWGVRRLRG